MKLTIENNKVISTIQTPLFPMIDIPDENIPDIFFNRPEGFFNLKQFKLSEDQGSIIYDPDGYTEEDHLDYVASIAKPEQLNPLG